MSLPTLADLHAHLRLDEGAEDPALVDDLAMAMGQVQTLVGAPLVALAQTLNDDVVEQEVYGVITTLLVPVTPIDATKTFTVTDEDGNLIDPTTYTLDALTGEVRAKKGVAFPTGRFAIVATVGLSAHPRYVVEVEPVLRAAILDIAADRYWRRNPGATSEREANMGVSYGPDGIPQRAWSALKSLRNSIGPQ